jgi:hypothetical protein
MCNYTLGLHACAAQHEDVHSRLSYMIEDEEPVPGSKICRTCQNTLKKGEKPKFCCGEQSPFIPIPNEVAELTDFESNFVSINLVFGSIRSLRVHRQQGIKGGMVCVPVQQDVTKRLPRTNDECEVVHVDLKRKMEFKHAYKHGNVRPAVLCRALDYLKTTPLYAKENIIYLTLEEVEAIVEAEAAAGPFIDQDPIQADIDHAALQPAGEPMQDAHESHGQDTLPTQALSDPQTENTQQQAHTDADGFQVVRDYDGCYTDESGATDPTVPIVTCIVLEKNAHELRQSVLAFAPAEGGHPTWAELQEMNPDDKDIFLPGQLEKSIARPADYEHLCLADFVAMMALRPRGPLKSQARLALYPLAFLFLLSLQVFLNTSFRLSFCPHYSEFPMVCESSFFRLPQSPLSAPVRVCSAYNVVNMCLYLATLSYCRMHHVNMIGTSSVLASQHDKIYSQIRPDRLVHRIQGCDSGVQIVCLLCTSTFKPNHSWLHP